MERSSRVVSVMAVGVVLLVAGCSFNKVKTPRVVKGKEWIENNFSKLPNDGIYGVGMATSSINPPVAMKQAKLRAVDEVASTLMQQVQSLTKDFRESIKDYTIRNRRENATEYFQSAIKQVVDQGLVGCQVVDTYVDSSTGLYYALAKLSKDNVAMQILEEFGRGISDGRAQVIKEKADAAFEELKKTVEEWKRR